MDTDERFVDRYALLIVVVLLAALVGAGVSAVGGHALAAASHVLTQL